MSGAGEHRFASLGDDVMIDPTARIIGAERISIGSHVRIDAFCVFSAGEGGITLGDHIHISAQCFFAGAGRIEIADFANVSARTAIFSSNDDYSGEHLMGPTVPAELTRVEHAPVTLERHAIIGSGCVVLPGVTMAEGAGAAAMSLLKEDVEPFVMVGGIPAKPIGTRSRRLLELEQQVRKTSAG